MNIGTQIKRKGLTVLATAAAAALSVPAALADPPQGHRALAPPDLIERWVDGRAEKSDLIARSAEIRRPVGFPDGRPDGYESLLRGTGVEAVVVSRTSADGFGWSDAGIGVAFGLALALIAGGTVLATRRRLAHS